MLALEGVKWDSAPPGASAAAVSALERGVVVFLPDLAFAIDADERAFFSPSIVTSKNVSFDPSSGRVGGVTLHGAAAASLRGLLQRFSDHAAAMAGALLPDYRARLERARTSFRPVEIAGRATSWRQDDTRLHVDSFPATPVQGRRILRVFTNVNPDGRARAWRVGEAFGDLARRFAPRLRLPVVGSAAALRLLRITKSRRSAYDALMLQLHDAMKADAVYQAGVPQTSIEFPAGSTWTAFTDSVSHAAMAGQYQLEQTFLLPVDAMREPERSPLRILERLKGRRLV
jgi:hypothetical protein